MKKSYLLIAIALIATLILGACGTPAETPVVEPEPPVVEEPTEEPVVEEPTEEPTVEVVEPAATLRIWADEQRAPVLSELGALFLAEYNVEVVVENISGIRDQFLVAAPAGEGPDIIVLAHDQLPALTESGLIAELDLGAKADEFDPESLKAFSYEGKLFGMPYARENLGFFYNADLVEEVPTTWQGVYDLSKTLIEAGEVQYGIVLAGTSYDAYPWMTSQGGYVFGLDENGDYNPSDVGVGSEGMIKFGEMALQWKNDGILSENLDGTTAKSMFLNGDVAFFMNGPWEIKNLKDSGLNFGIAKFPDGGYPFLGVQGFAVNSMSENVLLAQSFLTEFVATEEAMLALYEADPRGSAYLPAAAKIDDPYLQGIAIAGENAVPMPAIPAMSKVWGDWGNALTFIFDGSKTPAEAYTFAQEAIVAAIGTDTTGMINLPGSWQKAAGFACEWDPKCPDTAMTLGDDGLYTAKFTIPAGDYEIKVAHDGGWDTNYGVDGVAGGDNILFTVAADGEVTFVYDPETHLLDIQLP
jgi:maltose/maltodextrin transport system substrate-binding protein/arabinogalactan oligomer/maltooligosaccharide transport system substrate-binding protein